MIIPVFLMLNVISHLASHRVISQFFDVMIIHDYPLLSPCWASRVVAIVTLSAGSLGIDLRPVQKMVMKKMVMSCQNRFTTLKTPFTIS